MLMWLAIAGALGAAGGFAWFIIREIEKADRRDEP
jgi:hypothetical protein